MTDILEEEIKYSNNQINHLIAKTSNLLSLLKAAESELVEELLREKELFQKVATACDTFLTTHFYQKDDKWVVSGHEELRSKLKSTLRLILNRHEGKG